MQVGRAMAVARRLSTLVPPKIRAALLRDWLTGWCTGRRFQQPCPCIFGCPGEDAIEHYAVCSVVQQFARHTLALHAGTDGLADFLVLDAILSDTELVRRAVRTSAVYIVHCRQKHAENRGQASGESLSMTVREILRVHVPAARACAAARVG